MSKLIFSSLSILALLLSGANCATGKRGGGGGGSYPGCEVGLELNPGDGCSGPNYMLRNNAGTLVWSGSYFDSRSTVYIQGDSKISVTTNSYSYTHTTGGRFACDSLTLTENDNVWTIKSLPPPATTVR